MANKSKYDRLMAKLYSILLNTSKKQIKAATKDAMLELSALPKADKIDDDFIEGVIKNTNNLLGPMLQDKLSADVRELNKTLYIYTQNDVAKQIGASIGTYGNKQKVTVETLSKQNLFWIGKHYGPEIDNKLKPKLIDAMNEGWTNKQLADELLGMFNNLNRNPKYWEGFAENAMTRTKSIASVEAFEKHQIETAQIVAIMDERTTEICQELNGRIISVEKMIEVKNKLLDVQTDGKSSDEVRAEFENIVPFWKDAEDIKGQSTAQIQKEHTGIGLPPYHWRCRTEVIAYIEEFESEGEISIGEDAKTDKAIENLTKPEILEKLNSVIHDRYPKFDENSLEDQYEKQGKAKFNVSNKSEYIQLARDIVQNRDKILMTTNDGNIQFNVYSFAHKGCTVLDTNGVIKECFQADERAYKRNQKKSYEITGAG
jgi:hypothetical protein